MKIAFVIPYVERNSMVDNCLASLKSIHPDAQVILSSDPQHTGFAANVNRGVKRTDADVVVLVNSDILFTHPVLDVIEKAFTENQALGVLGAKLYYPNGKIQHAGGWMVGQETGHFGVGMTENQVGFVNEPYFCSYVTGALVAFRKATWEKVGGFDERFFLEREDQMFCANAWMNGYQVKYEPAFTAVHAESQTRAAEYGNLQRAAWTAKKDQGRKFWETEVYPFFDWNRMHWFVWKANGAIPEVLVCRNGAKGDLIALTAAIRQYKKDFPFWNVQVRTHHPEVFRGNPDVFAAEKGMMILNGLIIDLNCHLEIHAKDLYLWKALFHGMGLSHERQDIPRPVLKSGPSDLLALLSANGIRNFPANYVVMHCARTHWRSKSLPVHFYDALAVELLKAGLNLFVVGGAHDVRPTVAHPRIHDVRGRDDLFQLRELIRGAKAYIGVDSGPLWVAASTETPTFGLFTCTERERIFPPYKNLRGIKTKAACAGCLHRQESPVFWLECPDNKNYACVDGFDYKDVARQVLAEIEGVSE